MKHVFDPKTRKLVETDGQHLTDAQKEYFKDSKLRDRDGDLVQCFHYTNKNFDAFDKNYITDDSFCGRGFYFTSMTTFGGSFGQECLVCYVNMKNPLVVEDLDMWQKEDLLRYFAQSEEYKNEELPRVEGYPLKSEEMDKDALIDIIEYHEFKDPHLIALQEAMIGSWEYESFKESGNIEDLVDSMILYDMKKCSEFLEVIDERGLDRYIEGDYLEARDLTGDNFHHGEWNAFSALLTEWAQNNGYDGILSENGGLDMRIREVVIFEPNQIKSIDNLYPTKSDNFKDNSREYLSQHLKDLSVEECMKITKHIKAQEKENKGRENSKEREGMAL